MTGPDQWLRKVNLTLVSTKLLPLQYAEDVSYTQTTATTETVTVTATPTNSGLDLSAFRFTFRVEADDLGQPNTAIIRVYNLADRTVKSVLSEYNRVVLNAGYQNGNYGVIFDGTIRQFKVGREDNLNSYVEICAADGDIASQFGVVNASLAASSTAPGNQLKTVGQALAPLGVTIGGSQQVVSGGILPRGKVLFALGKDIINQLTQNKYSWSIQDGVVQFHPLTGYGEGEVVTLSAYTGLIGVPEATDNGIKVQCLLNPKFRVGSRVHLDSKDIATTIFKNANGTQSATGLGFPSYSSVSFSASTATDGIYMILVIDHVGDTRGDPWYTELTCLAVNQNVPPNNSVQAY